MNTHTLTQNKKSAEQKSFYSLSTFLKLLFSIALCFWMIQGGVLNLQELDVFLDHTWLIFFSIIFWLVGPIALSSLRWKILLSTAGFSITWSRSIRLQLVGVFFTSAMPGSLGGDLIKAIYLINDNPNKSKSVAFWSIIFDRIIGMLGLFLIGLIFISFNMVELWRVDKLQPLILMVFGYVLGFICLISVLRIPFNIEKNTHKTQSHLRKLLNTLIIFIVSIKVYGQSLKNIFLAIILSVMAHGLSFIFFASLCFTISSTINVSNFPELATVFPLGMLITTLPISPGGLGVGHFAFSELFEMVNLDSGANIFNAYFISQLLLNLTGVMSYLTIKKKSEKNTPPPTVQALNNATFVSK